jgi:superfamily II DNA or RNA helicase/HKD family nuclease
MPKDGSPKNGRQGVDPSPPTGAYHTLLTTRLERLLRHVAEQCRSEALDKAESPQRYAFYVAETVRAALAAIGGDDRVEVQAKLCNDLLRWLEDRTSSSPNPAAPTDADIVVPPRILTLVPPPLLPGQSLPALPDVPLADHDLLTNAPGEPSLAHALATELETADRVDAVIAFIRWTGLRHLEPALRRLRERHVPIRILTTTFTGSTERMALDRLTGHGIEVKVSYDTKTTRLHAKSWLIHRDTGYSTAFVGSSNLSHAALVDGIEWNVRLAEKAAPEVFGKLRATFESLWHDDGFEAYDPRHDAERFDHAVLRTPAGSVTSTISGLEIRPWPYQRQMLEALVAERGRHHRSRNLVVAPTGTGKTVVAALDYRALIDGRGGIEVPRNASLLFVAHREQILEQSLRTFRDVLRRGDFGERLVGRDKPREWRHVFASIQSLHQLGPDQVEPGQFDVVYVDEFHHAEASTYRTLLDHLRPRVLVGLTATPERTDGTNVRDRYFDGRYAFEMRLWDALDQQLLAPFHYFGVADGTDLSSLRWERGGYRTTDLEERYVVRDGNDARTAKVLEALRDRIGEPRRMRAIGFCVSIAHAHYMAERFTAAGIPSVAIDGGTPVPERTRAIDGLRDGSHHVVFAVDVLSEGIDVPEVDTILLLRPTESATVFLQQIGRGLRRAEGKAVCTVLDFIGQQHKKFRFDLRLRAMTGRTRAELLHATEQRFPLLPSGCHIQLDRQAEEHVLENLRAATTAAPKALAAELRDLAAGGREVTLEQFLTTTERDSDDVYRTLGWTGLRRLAGVPCEPPGPREAELATGLRLRLRSADDPERIAMLRAFGRGEATPASARGRRLASMVAAALFDDGNAPGSLADVQAALAREPAMRRELREFADTLEANARTLTYPLDRWTDVPLHVHATYTRTEILVALGDRDLGAKTAWREGVRYVAERNSDVLLVTLDKSGKHYSPTTRYRDYALAPDLFHWESQSGTSRRSPTGQRYLTGSSTVLLFVRSQPKDALGRAEGFVFLGPVTRVADRGERPIQIEWRLARPMPESLLRLARAAAI